MNSSVWGYMFLVLGLTGIVLINIFGEITIQNEQDYYSLKEVTKAAMVDSVDEYALVWGVGYDGVTQTTDPESMHCTTGVPGTIRIIKERFVELFMLKLAESVNTSDSYTITFNDIDECPPKVTVTVQVQESFSYIQRVLGVKQENRVEDANITNVITGILETSDPFESGSTAVR